MRKKLKRKWEEVKEKDVKELTDYEKEMKVCKKNS